MIKHISFDLDGTLVDSLAVMRESWQEATAKLGIACGFEIFRKYIGLPFDKILLNIGLNDYLSELSELYFEGTRVRQKEIAKIEGVDSLLEECRNRKLGLSIITSKPRANSTQLLEGIGVSVDHLICSDDVIKGKPDPQSSWLLCEKTGLNPREILYIGDMIFDFQFALNAGMQFVFFNNYGRSGLPSNLRNNFAEISSLSEVTQIVSSLNKKYQ